MKISKEISTITIKITQSRVRTLNGNYKNNTFEILFTYNLLKILCHLLSRITLNEPTEFENTNQNKISFKSLPGE